MEDQPAGWPKDVRRITFDESGEFGIDLKEQLYWKGKPIQIKKRLELTLWERILGIFGLCGAGVGGFAALFDVSMRFLGK